MKADMNWGCYWAYSQESEVDNVVKTYCYFNKIRCEPCKICKYYVRRDKIDDYIHHLLDEIEILTRLP